MPARPSTDPLPAPTRTTAPIRWSTPRQALTALLQLTPDLQVLLRTAKGQTRLMGLTLAVILAGTASYGLAFGVWRAPEQGLFSAIKLPILFGAVVAASALVNTALAQVSGVPLSLRETTVIILIGMAISALVLGALAPVACFAALQVPGPDPSVAGLAADAPAAAASMRVYRLLLLGHVGAVALAGLIGNIRLYRLLRLRIPSRRTTLRVLAQWLGVTGFVGAELAWLLSPFLCDPVNPPHIISRLYWQYNIYEYVWHCLRTGF